MVVLLRTQEIDITVKGGYSPDLITVTQSVPVRLNFDRQESGDCTSRVVLADFGASKTLPAFGTASVEFTPDKVGEYGFACGMNMIHGTLAVEPADDPPSAEHEVPDRTVARAIGVGPATRSRPSRWSSAYPGCRAHPAWSTSTRY